VKLLLHGDSVDWATHFRRFSDEDVLSRVRAVDARMRDSAHASLDAGVDPLVAIGMELDRAGRPIRNGYGVFNLAWQVAQHPEWANQVTAETREIRNAIRAAHGVPLRFLIWAGMGGSIEDKSMYAAVGLLRGRVRFYALDSADPVKLEAILSDIERRARRPLVEALCGTLVVGMALGMTSYEPIVNLQSLHALYVRHGLDARTNFLYLTLPDSLLDRFARAQGLRHVPLQLDGRYTTAGRHSGPLTRGSLYPLALSGVDMTEWMQGALLTDSDVMTAWQLAAFMHAHGIAGRDKVMLLLPRQWAGAALWTKQDFEESLGKSEEQGIKIVIGEEPRDSVPAWSADDRMLLVVRFRQELGGRKLSTLRHLGPPTAVLDIPRGAPLSRYMQFVHYAVFGMAYLRQMNFVTQPSVELYKTIANRLHDEASRAGGPTRTAAWRAMCETSRQLRWQRCLTLYFDGVEGIVDDADAALAYATLLRQMVRRGVVEYGELTFFGDMRYSTSGRAMHRILRRAADHVFRRGVNLSVDVYEGPAVNHSYHEMIIGHGRCFSTLLISAQRARAAGVIHGPGYHMAQFLATKLALMERRRPVAALVLKDLTESTLSATEGFFRAVAGYLGRERERT
jgi:glucose-6-phosphate isomerase